MDWSKHYDSTGEVNPPEARADHQHTVDEDMVQKLLQKRQLNRMLHELEVKRQIEQEAQKIRHEQAKQKLNEFLGYPRYRTPRAVRPAQNPPHIAGSWFTEGEKTGLFVAGMTMVGGLLLFIFSVVSLMVGAGIFAVGGISAALIALMSLVR